MIVVTEVGRQSGAIIWIKFVVHNMGVIVFDGRLGKIQIRDVNLDHR